jgi:hypothetical protein
MSSISQIDQILRAIRAQTVALPKPRGETVRADRADRSGLSKQPDIPAFVASRVQAIARDDPQRRRRAFRAFLEGVLLSMFGAKIFEERAFQEVLDKTQAAMEGDSQLSAAVDQTGDLLLAEAHRAQESGDLGAFAALIRHET